VAGEDWQSWIEAFRIFAKSHGMAEAHNVALDTCRAAPVHRATLPRLTYISIIRLV